MPMRRIRRAYRIGALLALCAGVPAAAQENVTASSGDPAVIARIRARFAAIERESPTYRQTSRDLRGYSLEGGQLEALFHGDELRKLTARFYGEMWRGREEYYFWADSLFFVYAVVEGYDRPLSGDVRVTAEHRYYFHDGRLIRRVFTQRPRDEDAGPYAKGETASELLANAKMFRACAAARAAVPPECVAREP
jgi:hypothetical protein